jgi:signal transduction histidine kinase/uncharacterized protein YaaR (DUF327 family)
VLAMTSAAPSNLRDRLFGPSVAAREKARLEAFLSAFPGEYCGFNPDGSLAYSSGFLSLLKLSRLEGLTDIQHALRPGDAAALEACFTRLKEAGQKFALKVYTADESLILRISGSSGMAPHDADRYDILWIEDITAQERDYEQTRDVLVKHEEKNRRLKSILDAVDHPVWLHDGRGTLVWCNQRYAELLQSAQDKIVTEGKELSFTPSKKKNASNRTLKEMVESALQAGTKQTDYKYLIIKGNRHLMQVDEIPVSHLDLVIGQALDVSKEEDLERESQRNLAANRELMEQLRAAIAIFGPDHKIEFYNSAYAQLWRLEENWLNTKPKLGDILEQLRETRRLPEQADFRRYKQGWFDFFTSLSPHEDMLYLPDGSALRMLVVPHPMGGLMMTFEDVSSRLELESSYNTLIAVQKETLDNLAEGIAVFGSNGRLQFWNPAFARMWELHPEDLEGQLHVTQILDRARRFFPAENWEEIREKIVSELLRREDRTGDITRTDGKILHYTSVALPDGGSMVTYQDVTDTVRVENALREKTVALETAERLKLDFLANVSYQLRTPLNAIIGFTELLDKEYFGPLNLRQKEYTKGLGEAGERLKNLIDDILDLSTIEAGYMTLNKDRVNIHGVLAGLFGLTQEWARSQHVEVSLSCADDIGTIETDELRLKQVLLNLIRNAIDFTPAGGRITLSAVRIGQEVALSVIDSGPGIAEPDQDRIFKPFERTDEAREGNSRGGAGLGLTLVKSIVELQGGRVQLSSLPGQGTAVTVVLPETSH